MEREPKAQSHPDATASPVLQSVALAHSPAAPASLSHFSLQGSGGPTNARLETIAAQSILSNSVPVENIDSRFVSSAFVRSSSQGNATVSGDSSDSGASAPQTFAMRQSFNASAVSANATADTALTKVATATNAQPSIIPSPARISDNGNTSRRPQDGSEIDGLRNVALPSARTGVNTARDGVVDQNETVARIPEAPARSSISSGDQTAQLSANLSRPVANTSSLANSSSPQIQEIFLQSAVRAIGTYFDSSESVLPLSRLGDQQSPVQAPAIPPTPAAASAPARGIPVAMQSMFSSSAARTPGSSDALPLPGGASQNNGTVGAGPAKSSSGVSTVGDGSDNQSQNAAGTPDPPARNSTNGDPTARLGARLTSPGAGTSRLASSSSSQIQEISLQDAVHAIEAYFGSSDALPLPGGASQNNGAVGAGPAKGFNAVSTVGDGRDNQSQTAARTADAPAHSSTNGDQTAQQGANSSRAVADTSRLASLSSPQSQETSLQDVSPTWAAGSVPVKGISVPVAMQSMFLSPVAGTPGSSDAFPLSGGASQNNGPVGAGLAKGSSGVSTVGDGKDDQSQTAANTSNATVHNSTNGDQTAQQGVNLTRPGADTSRLASPSSPQIQGSSLQGAVHAVEASASRSESVPQSAQLGDRPSPLQSSEIPATSVINTASLIQKMSETEMRVAVHSTEFGEVSILTSLSQQQMMAQITVDHGGLGNALSAHVPAMEAKLGNDLGVRTVVQVNQSAMSFSGDGSNSQQGGQRSFRSAPAGTEIAPAPVESEDPGVRLAAMMTGNNRLDIRA